MSRILICSWIVMGACVASARADTIVQEGSLSGYAGEPTVQSVVLEQFDTFGDTRWLNFVQLDLYTSVIGGGTTTGGPAVSILVQLDADYYLGMELLADTQALVQLTVPNNVPNQTFTVFDSDTQQVIIDDPSAMETWIGSGEVALTVWAQMAVEVNPPDIISFSAGGSVHYTVTYDYDVIACLGDLTADEFVDAADLALLLGSWGPCPGCPGDMTADDLVDAADLALLLGAWGACG